MICFDTVGILCVTSRSPDGVLVAMVIHHYDTEFLDAVITQSCTVRAVIL